MLQTKGLTLSGVVLSSLNKIFEIMGGERSRCKRKPHREIPKIVSELDINAVYFGEDYEARAIERDKRIKQTLIKYKTRVRAFKDQVILGKSKFCRQKGLLYCFYTLQKSLETKNGRYLVFHRT